MLGIESETTLFSGLYTSLKHPLNSPLSPSFYREAVMWMWVDDCARGKGFEMLVAARGHLTLPSLQLLLRVMLNALWFVIIAVVLLCRNCAGCVCSSCCLMKSVFLGLQEMPGSQGEVQTSPCIGGCRWLSQEHWWHSSVVSLSDI